MSSNQRNNNASTINLSTSYIIWCGGQSVGSFESGKAAQEFLKKCPRGSYIQYPMGAIRDHQIAKARKTEFPSTVKKEEWDDMRRRQKARRAALLRASLDQHLSPEELARRAVLGE